MDTWREEAERKAEQEKERQMMGVRNGQDLEDGSLKEDWKVFATCLATGSDFIKMGESSGFSFGFSFRYHILGVSEVLTNTHTFRND